MRIRLCEEVAPRIGMNLSANDDGDSRVAEAAASVAFIRSGVSGNFYEFRSINQEASSCVTNPFERVLLQVAIEKSDCFWGSSRESRKMALYFESKWQFY